MDSTTTEQREPAWEFTTLFGVSLAVAAVAFLVPPALMLLFGGHGEASWLDFALRWSVKVLPLVWLFTVGIGVYDFRLKGLWLLLGTPLAFCWPGYVTMILWGCLARGDCL